jgi:hypothetical protein
VICSDSTNLLRHWNVCSFAEGSKLVSAFKVAGIDAGIPHVIVRNVKIRAASPPKTMTLEAQILAVVGTVWVSTSEICEAWALSDTHCRCLCHDFGDVEPKPSQPPAQRMEMAISRLVA